MAALSCAAMSQPGSNEPGPAPVGRRPVIALFTSHWLAMFGFALVVTSIVLWLCLMTVQLRSGHENPYIGVAMLGAGGVLLIGLVVTPLGLMLGRRRLGQRLAASVVDGR